MDGFLKRVWLVATPVLVGLLGAWVALLAFGADSVSMGPFDVRLQAGFGRGETSVDLPPLGGIRADTHTAPLRLRATVDNVRLRELGDIIDAGEVGDVITAVERDAIDHLGPFALRTAAVTTGGALLAAAAIFRRDRRRVAASVVAVAVLSAATGLAAWRTFRPAAFEEPTFSGALTLAPQLIGPVEEATTRIEGFRRELSHIVAGAIRVYANIEPGVSEGGGVRVLHISDVHLNPLGLDFALELARGFDVDFVIDTGDLSSFGTSGEHLALSTIERFDRPYVFVRGNHDSIEVQDAVGELGNVTVLDGEVTEVSGITIYGLGHPVFTADQAAPVEQERYEREARQAGTRIDSDLARLGDVDLVAVHDDRMAEAVAGRVPLVISGHHHRASMRTIDGTIFLRVGTTGGGGLDVFTRPGGVPLEAQILSFTTDVPARLVAVDRVSQSPESGRLVVERELIDTDRASPSPAVSPGSPSPTRGSTPRPGAS